MPRILIRFILLASVVGFGAGLMNVYNELSISGAPMVDGTIIRRTPYRLVSIPRMDMAIRIDGTTNVVHARIQKNTADRVPQKVRFRFREDFDREVILSEYERSSWWQVSICGAGIILFGTLFLRNRREEQ